MGQLFLDPQNLPRHCSHFQHVPASLPQSVRDLGHLPNLELLLPGDLILISPISPTSFQREIQKTQKTGGYHKDDAQWTHAAVYLGWHFNICEATIKSGVRQASLLDSLATHRVRFRRFPGLDVDFRWKIAVSAALQIGTSYGIVSAIKIYLRSTKGLHLPQKAGTKSRSKLICSELYADSLLAVTSRTLQYDHPGKDLSPALLSHVEELEDVPVDWLKI